MQLVHPAHHGEIGCGNRSGQIIYTATADLQGLRLFADRQFVVTVDHRFALSKPALLSAPPKKSFSSVSSPIFAWSDFRSIAGGAGPLPAADPDTPAAPSSSCAFHWVTSFGCTSNCCATSASISSPLTAASATFALNAGVWFRRGRLLMFSPVRLPSWPLAGRNSNYPAVQILPASSLQEH